VKKTLITIELFLILLIVVLFGFLLFIFTNSKIDKNPVIPVATVDTSELYCGISITSPQIDSEVSLPLEVSGYISGCGWEPFLNYVAKLEIYDSENNSIGRPFLVPKKQNGPSPVSTQFHFTINNLPIEEGKVNFVFKNFSSNEKTTTIPVTIVKKTEEDNI